MIIMSCRLWFLWWLFVIDIFSYHSYSVLCLTNMLSDAFTVIVHCKKYPLRHMWVLADTLLWFQAITVKWYVLSREVANAKLYNLWFHPIGNWARRTQNSYVNHYTTEVITYAHIDIVRQDMDENNIAGLSIFIFRHSAWIAVLHFTVIVASSMRITRSLWVWNVPMLAMKGYFIRLLSINATPRHLFPFDVIWRVRVKSSYKYRQKQKSANVTYVWGRHIYLYLILMCLIKMSRHDMTGILWMNKNTTYKPDFYTFI